MTTVRDALDRTLLLMRDEVQDGVTDDTLLDALTRTEVVITADAETLQSPAAQNAFITTAMLGARSGHKVHLMAPDIPLSGVQPPFRGRAIVSALLEADADLLPIKQFSTEAPTRAVDVCITLGQSRRYEADRSITMWASPWSTSFASSASAIRWDPSHVWPFGALAGSGILAGEVFKAAMRKLRSSARNLELFGSMFRPVDDMEFVLAPEHTPMPTDLGGFDFVSGGAITNAAIYALSRIPGVTGQARVIEPDIADYSNLNRYALLRCSDIPQNKASLVASMKLGGLSVTPIEARFVRCGQGGLHGFAPRVLVGVDHIPTRWNVQKENPQWLGVGATTHWSAMASFHCDGLACAGCVHPTDDPLERPIPTVAFVSFMSGLILATYFVRAVSEERIAANVQQTYLTPLRPEGLWQSSISQNKRCPIGSANPG